MEKFELYQVHEVKEYIIIDPVAETISQYTLDEKTNQYKKVPLPEDQFIILSSMEKSRVSITEIFS